MKPKSEEGKRERERERERERRTLDNKDVQKEEFVGLFFGGRSRGRFTHLGLLYYTLYTTVELQEMLLQLHQHSMRLVDFHLH